MYTTEPRIDDILTRFFAAQLEGQTGIARRRIEKVERLLRECTELEGDRMLTDDDYAILAVERAFQPEAAIARIMHAEDLLWVLGVFLRVPWRLSDPLALRVQVRLTEELTSHIVLNGLVCVACADHPLQHVREGLEIGKRELNRRQSSKRRKRTGPPSS